MRTPRLPALIVASLVAGLASSAASQVRPRPGGAHAGDGRSSGGSDRGLLDKGTAALTAGDLPTAARLLSEAYRQFPRAAVLHALARLATAQGRTLDAYDLYRRYLADPSREADEAATRTAESLLNQPAPESGSLTVLSDPGALVLLDGRVVATLPLLLPLLVAPGPHTVKLEFSTKNLEAPVQVELGRQTEVRMSRSSGAVLVSVLPAILWSRSGSGFPADTGRQLADAVEQAARDEQYTLVRTEVLQAKGEKTQPCLTSEPCQRELAMQHKLDLVLQEQVQAQGAAPSLSYQINLRLLQRGYVEPAGTATVACAGCSVEQVAARLKDAAAKLLADGLARPRGTLSVHVTPEAAALQLGDRPLRPAPAIEPLWAGTYTVTARHPGYQAESRTVEIADGKPAELSLELSPSSQAAVAAAPPVAARPRGRAPRPRWRLAVGGTAIGVGLGLGIAGALGVAADGQCTTPPEAADGACPLLYDTAPSGGAALGLGVALVGAGIVLMALPGPAQ